MLTAPTLLLVRPNASSKRMAQEVLKQVPGAAIVISPILDIKGTGNPPNIEKHAGIIATSQNVAAFLPELNGKPAYVVGARTAEALRKKGAQVVAVFDTADALFAGIKAEGPLIHLRGTHTRGDLAHRLSLAGVETHEAVLYDQRPLPLSADAKALIASNAPLILPLFSPRSAALIAACLSAFSGDVAAIAMSPATTQQWQTASGRPSDTLDAPTSQAMMHRIVAMLRQ